MCAPTAQALVFVVAMSAGMLLEAAASGKRVAAKSE